MQDIINIHDDLKTYSTKDIRTLAKYYRLPHLNVSDLRWLIAVQISQKARILPALVPVLESIASNLSVPEIVALADTNSQYRPHLSFMLKQNSNVTDRDYYHYLNIGRQDVANALLEHPNIRIPNRQLLQNPVASTISQSMSLKDVINFAEAYPEAARNITVMLRNAKKPERRADKMAFSEIFEAVNRVPELGRGENLVILLENGKVLTPEMGVSAIKYIPDIIRLNNPDALRYIFEYIGRNESNRMHYADDAAISAAIQNKNVDMLRHVLSIRPDARITGKYITEAVNSNNAELVRLLLQNRDIVDIDSKPLTDAVINGNVDIVAALLNDGRFIINQLYNINNPEIRRLLLEHTSEDIKYSVTPRNVYNLLDLDLAELQELINSNRIIMDYYDWPKIIYRAISYEVDKAGGYPYEADYRKVLLLLQTLDPASEWNTGRKWSKLMSLSNSAVRPLIENYRDSMRR